VRILIQSAKTRSLKKDPKVPWVTQVTQFSPAQTNNVVICEHD